MASICVSQGADLDAWIAKVRQCEYLPENDLKTLCQMVSENLCKFLHPAYTALKNLRSSQ
jgi:hypothetical protein